MWFHKTYSYYIVLMTIPRSYIICATTRSGSTLLCKLLSDSAVAGNPQSYFHRPEVQAWAKALNVQIRNTESENETLCAIFRAAIDKGSGESDMFGLRLMRKSFDYFMHQLTVLYPDVQSDRMKIEAAFGPTQYLHLTRTDKIRQAISVVKANQTGLWHMASDGTELERNKPAQAPSYDEKAITQQVAELLEYDREWDLWFDQQKIRPHRITYENLEQDPTVQLSKLLQYLGLNCDAAKDVQPTVKKLADAVNDQWAERYRLEHGKYR